MLDVRDVYCDARPLKLYDSTLPFSRTPSAPVAQGPGYIIPKSCSPFQTHLISGCLSLSFRFPAPPEQTQCTEAGGEDLLFWFTARTTGRTSREVREVPEAAVSSRSKTIALFDHFVGAG